MNEFSVVGLYDHNADSYRKVREAFETSDVVGIVHATGTGKSYNALQLAYDNKDKRIVYVVPSVSIVEHIRKIINDNPNLDMERDFPNLEFRTYQSFINMDTDEISELDIDLLILDEFHHIGAPVWGSRIDTVIDTHPDMKVFGMTAYTVRDRGTSYERDMALDEGDELFSDSIVSEYDLCDAMIDGVLPKPIYRSSYIKLYDMASELEQRVQRLASSGRDCSEYIKILSDVKKRIHEAPSMGDVVKKNIKKNGKYIYFCPPFSEEGTNDIESIKKEAMSWFKEIAPEEDIVIYTSLSEMKDGGKSQREAFYDDLDLDGNKVDGKLRVMFAINQYNEGVHAPNIDGVIMGRGTCSDIVFFEQLGRALSVSSGVKEKIQLYSTYSIERLRLMCSQNNISFNNDMSKNDLIEKLVAPVIIDLAGNIDFIRKLEDNLKDRLKELKEKGNGTLIRGVLSDASFDLDMYEVNLFNILEDLKEKTDMTWDNWYKLAEEYFNEHGDLNVPFRYITSKGEKLGNWLICQRKAYKFRYISKESRTSRIFPLTDAQVQKLERIGMIWDVRDNNWMEMYKAAKKYFLEHHNLNVPRSFVTDDGKRLGHWLGSQRSAFFNKAHFKPLSEYQIELLGKIGMIWDVHDNNWMEMYEAAKKYFLEHHNLNITSIFITDDGKKLGSWINEQRKKYRNNNKNNNIKSLSDEKVKLLEKIGMVWYPFDNNWMKMYELAEKYFLEHGDLDVPLRYIENDITLGVWISNQRKAYKNRMLSANERKNTFKPLSDSQVELLEKIGIKWDALEYDVKWMEMYEVARNYFLEHHNLNVKNRFVTEDGKKLGQWIRVQREAYKLKFISKEERTSRRNPLTDEQVFRLESVGMIWEPKKVKPIEDICKKSGIDVVKNTHVIQHISLTEFKVKLSYLKDNGINIVDESGKLHEIFSMSSMNMKLKYGVSLEDLVNIYGKEKSK